MSSIMRLFLTTLLVIVSGFMLTIIDTNGDITQPSQFSMPLIFAVVLSTSIFYQRIRKYFIMLSFCLFVIMLLFYFVEKIEISDWFGSLGFGILIIVIFSYFPNLFKQGHIDRF